MSDSAPEEDQLRGWTEDFDLNRGRYDDLRREVHSELRRRIHASPIRIHDLRSRVKTKSSFREKILRKQYSEPLTEMTDIVGARVVCLFLDDLEQIDSALREAFEVLKYEDKTKEAPPERFGYRSVHYDCLVPSHYNGPHYDHIKDIVFEVQVRTILQDAWAVIEHYLGYKGINSIPKEARADFSALVGLFHLADKTFQQIRDTSERKDAEAETTLENATTSKPDGPGELRASADVVIDRSTLRALLRQIYPERRESENIEYSTLVEELAAVNVTRINQLRELLADANDAALAEEKRHPPTNISDQPTMYSDVGLTRTAMKIADPEYSELLMQKFFPERFKSPPPS